MKLSLRINGEVRKIESAAGDSLMDVLRRLGYLSVKNGCDRGDCGSCAVLIDGRAVTSCLVFAGTSQDTEITTAEALASGGDLHPLQAANLDAAAVQCGFCTPGLLMTAIDLLKRNPDPSEQAVREAFAGSYCRCTGYVKPVEAVLDAARRMRGDDDG